MEEKMNDNVEMGTTHEDNFDVDQVVSLKLLLEWTVLV